MPSITLSSPNILPEGPIIEVQFLVSASLEANLRQQNKQVPNPVTVRVLIDTGCGICSVSEEIPKQLGIEPIGVTTIFTAAGEGQASVYFMRMRITTPNGIITWEGKFNSVILTRQNISGLIGRDLLQHGNFLYLGNSSQFVLSLL